MSFSGEHCYVCRKAERLRGIPRGAAEVMISRLLIATTILICGALLVMANHEVERPLEMVFIPGGEFIMGTSEEEIQRLAQEYDVHPSLFKYEQPQRKIYVKSFLIDRYPVTNAEYKKFIDATGHRPPRTWVNGQYPKGQDDYPVTGVTWNDAAAYAKWAGKRLPTAEEWEKAARGTDGRTYPWGNKWRDDACWTDDPACPQTLARTTPVGAFPAGASPYGVMDMCGNVAEWTATEAAPANKQRNWHWYVIKGAGGAHRQQYNFRCAARSFSAHQSRWHKWLGFRCAMDADQPPPNLAPPRPTPPLPPPPTAPGPEISVFGTQPIKIVPGGGAGATILVPYFPQGVFRVFAPEHLGAEGLPLGWGMKHEPIRWQTSPDGTRAWYICRWPGVAEATVTLEGKLDHVDLTISLKNLTDKPMRRPYSNVCFNPHDSPYFEDFERIRTMAWTDEGPVSLNKLPAGGPGEPMHAGWAVAVEDAPARAAEGKVRYPFIFIVSRDGQFTIAQACERAYAVASNAHYSCLHVRPVWPDIPAGQEGAVKTKLYFIKGGPAELLARWKKDFGR